MRFRNADDGAVPEKHRSSARPGGCADGTITDKMALKESDKRILAAWWFHRYRTARRRKISNEPATGKLDASALEAKCATKIERT